MSAPTITIPARQRAQIKVSSVSLARGAVPVLNNIDLAVTPSSRIAVVGENGRGKSTLLGVLNGSLTPDDGAGQRVGTYETAEQQMSTSDSRTVGQVVAQAIAQSLAALAELDETAVALTTGDPGADQRYTQALEHAEALDAWDAERRVHVALEALGAETDMSKRLDSLSVGQRYRVRLACLLGSDEDFLFLDEPTNHLDDSGLDFLTGQLRERRGGVVIVTHDRALLKDVAETFVDLDPTPDGKPRVYGDGYEGYRAGRAAEQERWEQEYSRQTKEHSRLQDSLSSAQDRLISGWRPDKGTHKHGRASRAGGLVQSVHRRQEQLEAHAVTVPEPPLSFHFPGLSAPRGRKLLGAEGVSVSDRLSPPVSLSLSRGERLVVTGANGAGKSTLLKVLAGTLSADAGSIRKPRDLRLGFLRQETNLPMHLRAREAYAARIDTLLSERVLPPSDALSLSQLGLLREEESRKRIAELSMGQQRRLNLVLVLAERPQVLLLDEPTNHLSIGLVDELTEALDATHAAVVLATHDRQVLRDTDGWPSLNLPVYPGGSSSQ